MAQTKKNGKQYAASRLLSFLRRLSPSKIHTYTSHHPQPRLLYGREIVVAVARDVVGLYIYAIFPVVPHHLAVHFRVRMIAVHPLLPSYAPRSRQLAPNLMVQAEHGLMAQIFQRIQRFQYLCFRLVVLVDVGISQSDVCHEASPYCRVFRCSSRGICCRSTLFP